jgi:hypothetical protein
VRRIAATSSTLLLSIVLAAQAQTPGANPAGFEKNNYNHSERTKLQASRHLSGA